MMCSKLMHWTSGACGGASIFDGTTLLEMITGMSATRLNKCTFFHYQVMTSLNVLAHGLYGSPSMGDQIDVAVGLMGSEDPADSA